MCYQINVLEGFVNQIIEQSNYQYVDKIYLMNRIRHLVGEVQSDNVVLTQNIIDLKNQLVDVAVHNGRCPDTISDKEALGAELMNFITPIPSVLNQQFWQTYQESPAKAIKDFHILSQKNDYIKVADIAKNVEFKVATEYGDLEITINLSKPEKDPKEIVAAKLASNTDYPQCMLCMENEGYQGRVGYPARANHRIIRLKLEEASWGFQYSPYAYFNEHCIFLNEAHVPMVIEKVTFKQLLNIVELFPGYFAGSNSDLPIVGGSILTHNHYQGGRHIFPMEEAPYDEQFIFTGFEDVQAGIIKWPMSVIRLISDKPQRLVDLAEKIRLAWRDYSDESVDIIAYTNDTPHHTVTPIARRRDDKFELDIVLRDNHTSIVFPDGVYHPHQDLHHIKKENIGLIEVMGLAILPPRLATELQEVEKFLLGRDHNVADYHLPWAKKVKQKYHDFTNIKAIIQQELGLIFVRVLEDAGVYKRNEQGQQAFRRFIESMGINN